MPKLSWVIPTRNRLEWIGESLQSLLMQTIVKDTEIIVVNDASDDGTKEFLDEWAAQFPEVKIIHNEKQLGGGRSRNIGMEAAQSDIIGVCDDDDISVTERGELILKHFTENPNSELVTFSYQAIGYFNEKIEDVEGRSFDYDAYEKGGEVFYCNPSSAHKKKSAQEIGGFEPENEKETDDLQFLRKWIAAGKKVDFQPGGMVTLHRNLPNSMMVAHRGWSPKWMEAKR